MINRAPENWKYDNSVEMLFLFYQCTDELMSEQTSDTYALPLHNTMSLVFEVEEVYELLKKYHIIQDYYLKYVPPIIDELIKSVESDYLFKKQIGKRIDSIKTGLMEAKDNHVLLERWINIIKQACSLHRYLEIYKNEIKHLVIETTEKNRLIYCIKNYYIALIQCGYSREHIYITSKKFFNNRGIVIDNKKQIVEFLNLFDCKKKKHEFILLMDTGIIDYVDDISDSMLSYGTLERIDVQKERQELCKDFVVKDLLKEYDKRLHNAGKHEKLDVVRFTDRNIDPYMAVTKLNDYVNFLLNFKRYFIHFYSSKQIYKVLVKNDDGYYKELKLPQRMRKRPYVKQEVIDLRIKNILHAKAMDFSAFESIMKAIEMHAEAIDSKNTSALLRTLWISLETLFSNPLPNSVRDNVINSVLPIIQKTYILKLMRELYYQISSAIESENLEALGIQHFESFVEYFSKNELDSAEMKKIYNLLGDNPLLRSRIYSLRKQLDSGSSISKLLSLHNTRIEWQLRRIYRLRNIVTHLGVNVSNMDIAMNHLHNYFDYAVNYMLCKSENSDNIVSTSAVVIEAKNDNAIHYEILKSNKKLSDDNYNYYLFGPDPNLIHYKFEF